MTGEFIFFLALQFIGMGATLFLAYRSFQKRRIQLGEEPTLPQYFIRRSTYWTGIILYCVSMAVFYALLTWLWLPLPPLISLIFSHLRSGQWVDLLNGLDGSKIVPLIAAGLLLFFVGWENKFNPLLVLRDSVHDAFAIPTKAVEVYNALIKSRLSAIDDQIKAQIADRLLVQSIDPGDFDKSSATVEYKWAHNGFLFDQIQTYANQSSFRRLFNEPSLKWGEICISFNAMSEKINVWKQAEPHYTKTVNLLNELDRLTGLLCRMLASLVVFGSANESELWATVKQLGGNADEARYYHPYKSILIFTGATAIGVILGREITVTLHNAFLFPDKPLAHFSAATLRWIAYAIAMYVLPISLVFVARNLVFRQRREVSYRNYGFYMAMMITGFFVSTAVSMFILELTYYHRDSFAVLDSFIQHARWGILPALLSGFVAYRMDTPASASESLLKLAGVAATQFFAWGALGIVIMLYATDDLPTDASYLRFTIVGTVFFGIGLLAAVTRFKSPATD